MCWAKVQEKNRIWDRFRHWREVSQLSVGYNIQDTNKLLHQPGVRQCYPKWQIELLMLALMRVS